MPMIIIVFRRSLTKSLVVSFLGTIIFALALAVKARNLKGIDILAATAAYAAVLVVFVGTSLPPVT
jgi:hypothetical protein